uniref:Intraflagellar transport protein 140 homolog n=1 Tax=Steinernema glaseri TaxID=37863 RepID=A0A1I8A687_9BILA
MAEDAFVEECSLGLHIDRVPIVFDGASRRAFVTSNKFVLVFNAQNGKRENVLSHDNPVAGAFFREGKLVTLTAAGECCVWEAASGKLLFCRQLELSQIAFVYPLKKDEEEGDCVYILGAKEGDKAERVFRCTSDLSVEDVEVQIKDAISLSKKVENHRDIAFGKDFVVVCNGKFLELFPLAGSTKSPSRYEMKQQFERVVDNSRVVWDGVSVNGDSVSATLSTGRVYIWRRVAQKGLTNKNSSFIHPGQTEIVHAVSQQHTVFCGTGECTVSKWSLTVEGAGRWQSPLKLTGMQAPVASLSLSQDECLLAVVLENTALLFVKTATMTILSSAEQLLWPRENALHIKCDPLRLDTLWFNPVEWKTVQELDVCQDNVPNRVHTLYNEFATWSDVYLTCLTTQMIVTAEKQNDKEQKSLLKFWRRTVSRENEAQVYETVLEDSVDFEDSTLVSLRGDEDVDSKSFVCDIKPIHSQQHTDQIFVALDDAGYFYILKADALRFGGWCVDHLKKAKWQSSRVIHSSSLRSNIFASVNSVSEASESTFLLLWNVKNEEPKVEYIEDSIADLRTVEWSPSGNESTFRYLLYSSEQAIGSYDVEALCVIWTVALPGTTLFVSPTLCIAGNASDYCSFDPEDGHKLSSAKFSGKQELVLSSGDLRHFNFVGYNSQEITVLKNTSKVSETVTKSVVKKTPFSELLEITKDKDAEVDENFALDATVASKLFDGPAHALAPVTQLAPLFIRSCLIK